MEKPKETPCVSIKDEVIAECDKVDSEVKSEGEYFEKEDKKEIILNINVPVISTTSWINQDSGCSLSTTQMEDLLAEAETETESDEEPPAKRGSIDKDYVPPSTLVSTPEKRIVLIKRQRRQRRAQQEVRAATALEAAAYLSKATIAATASRLVSTTASLAGLLLTSAAMTAAVIGQPRVNLARIVTSSHTVTLSKDEMTVVQSVVSPRPSVILLTP